MHSANFVVQLYHLVSASIVLQLARTRLGHGQQVVNVARHQVRAAIGGEQRVRDVLRLNGLAGRADQNLEA